MRLPFQVGLSSELVRIIMTNMRLNALQGMKSTRGIADSEEHEAL